MTLSFAYQAELALTNLRMPDSTSDSAIIVVARTALTTVQSSELQLVHYLSSSTQGESSCVLRNVYIITHRPHVDTSALMRSCSDRPWTQNEQDWSPSWHAGQFEWDRRLFNTRPV